MSRPATDPAQPRRGGVAVPAGRLRHAARRFGLDRRYGPADPTRFDQPQAPAPGGVSYRADVAPILQQRCVVCHGCYDAPCQIKLGAWEGIARGGSKLVVYDADRLSEAAPTRLFVDAQLPSQWRDKGFFPVLNERAPTPEANLAASVLYRSLALKQQHPLPAQPVLGEGFDFSLDRANACPRVEQYDAFAAAIAAGRHALRPARAERRARWASSRAGSRPVRPMKAICRCRRCSGPQVRHWEAFLNGASNKERLMSRYLFEHLFLGHLHFDADPDAPALPAGALEHAAGPAGADHRHAPALRRPRRAGVLVPAANPSARRCWPRRTCPTHWARRAWTSTAQWFLAAGFEVGALPSYAIEVASNPFVAFRELPVDARYRFLLDEAQFFIMNFIKGPVCRGQMAVDVIEDHFWVFFVDPRAEPPGSRRRQADAPGRGARSCRPSQGSDCAAAAALAATSPSRSAPTCSARAALLQQAAGSGGAQLDLSWSGTATGATAMPH